MFRDRCIHHTACAEFLKQFPCDLIGTLILGHLFTHYENGFVTAHLFGHGVAQCVPHRRVGKGSAFGDARV